MERVTNTVKRAVTSAAALFLSLASMLPGVLSAQMLDADTTLVRDAIRRYSTQHDSIQSPENIPAHIWAQLAYKTVLLDVSLQAAFTSDDVAIIAALPAHTDHRFIEQEQSELAVICTDVSQQNLSDTDVISIAGAFDDSRLRRDNTLNRHYAQVMASLSPQGQDAVLALIDELKHSRHVAHTSFEIGAFALEFPAEALEMLQGGCQSFHEQLQHYSPRSLTLLDQR